MLPLLLAFGAGAALSHLFKSNAKTTSVSTGLEEFLPHIRDPKVVSSAQRRSYDTAAAASKALLEQYNALVATALRDVGLLQLRLPGLPSGEADTNAMRAFASKLAYVSLTTQANHLRTLATQIDNLRAAQPAPGGAPLSPPTHTSPFAVTRGAQLPGISFIVKPAHYRDMDGEKILQEFIGKMIPVINSALGLGMVSYADPTLHAGEAWKPVWSSFGRDPKWGTYSGDQIARAIYYSSPEDAALFGRYPTFLNPETNPADTFVLAPTEAGTSQQGIFAAAAAVMQIPGFKEIMDTGWIVPDGTHAKVLFEHLRRPGTRYLPWARIQFQLPMVGAGPLGTAEGFIEMQDLERRMVYSEGAVV